MKTRQYLFSRWPLLKISSHNLGSLNGSVHWIYNQVCNPTPDGCYKYEKKFVTKKGFFDEKVMFGLKKVTNTFSKTTWQKFLESGPNIFSRLSWMMLTSAVNHGRKVMFGLKNPTNTFSKTTWQKKFRVDQTCSQDFHG
jgi:hypothetical protein